MSALIIGGGVAGWTAAMWLHRYEAPFDWVTERAELGGMLATVHNPIIDYPGLAAETGAEAVAAMREWGRDLPAPDDDQITRIRATDDGFEVVGRAQTRHHRFVLIATGTRRKLLGIPGESEGLDDWVLTSTTRDPEQFAGRRVMLVGGGDAAVEGALNVRDAGADEVIVVSRSPFRAQRHFVDRLRDDPRTRHWPTFATPTAFERRDDGCRVHLDTGESLDVDLVVVRIGIEPVRPKIDPKPKLDDRGFIVVDGRGETDLPGLFAAGDVTSTPLRSIATSVGDGTRAARSIAELLQVWT
jgi:thioredoxin reductase (NADPH)